LVGGSIPPTPTNKNNNLRPFFGRAFFFHGGIGGRTVEEFSSEELYEPKSRQQFVWANNNAGNEYACPVNVFKKTFVHR